MNAILIHYGIINLRLLVATIYIRLIALNEKLFFLKKITILHFIVISKIFKKLSHANLYMHFYYLYLASTKYMI